jgi:DNA-directed RNA polymerase specialized sigma24 family protein
MQIAPLKAIFTKKSAPQTEDFPDYARLIVDHLPYIEKQCRRAAESPGNYRSDADVDNEADHLLTEVLDHLKADDFKVLRDFRGSSKLTTYLTAVISNLVVDIIRTRKGRSRAGERLDHHLKRDIIDIAYDEFLETGIDISPVDFSSSEYERQKLNGNPLLVEIERDMVKL